eukprot:TRINITY_DN7237_c0_g2_i1.p1 TRINITY_DN7237_c0_g2~~TRINITY_DN7237_c0_g2_i1.p1  ORF type:complete len:318 (-),score=69.00 TRINITY_DN7237_c0_g2_i1:199-1152(-)
MQEYSNLGDRIKQYEAEFESRLPKECPFVVRLDGCSASKYTAPFHKPYDPRFHRSMVAATAELVEKFNARIGYTQSDEITLLFPSAPLLRKPATDHKQAAPDSEDKGEEAASKSSHYGSHIYDGRVMKIASILASAATMAFARQLSTEEVDEVNESTTLVQRVRQPSLLFDARVFSVPNEREAFLSLWWRHYQDCNRNAIHGAAMAQFPHAQLENKNRADMLRMLDELSQQRVAQGQPPCDFASYPPPFKFGTFVKKLERTGVEQRHLPKTEPRSFLMRRVGEDTQWEAPYIQLCFDKYWPENPDSSAAQSQPPADS